MKGKQTSWLLRALSLTLAALMVFGNLILPGGIWKASAEEASTTLFSTDFESESSISIGSSIYSGNRGWQLQGGTVPENMKVGIEKINGNKVLAVTKTDSTTASSAFDLKFDLYNGTNTDATVKSAVLSYNIALTDNMQVFFPTICNANNIAMAAYFGSNVGSLVYRTTGGSGDTPWLDMHTSAATVTSKLETYKWYTVKEVYTLAEGDTPATVQVYVDDVLTKIELSNSVPTDIGGFVMRVHKWSCAGSVYIDNINFTTVDHDPAEAPVTVAPNKVHYATGFEKTDAEKFVVGDFGTFVLAAGVTDNMASSKYPNWSINGSTMYDTDKAAVAIKKINGNQVLSISNQCGTESSRPNCTVQLRRNGTGGGSDCWLTYNFAVSTKSAAAFGFAPCGYSGMASYFGVNSGEWKWNDPAAGGWASMTYADGSAIPYEALTWYTVEVHYYLEDGNGKVEVYVDGKLTNAGMKVASTAMTINRIMLELNKWGVGDTEMFIDDVQLTSLRASDVKKPASLIAEDHTVFEDDFEGYAKGAMATNDVWSVSGVSGEDNTVKVVSLNGNQVLELTNAPGTNIVVSHALGESYDSLTMTYHAAFPNAVGATTFFPSFTNSNGFASCYGLHSGQLKYERYDVEKADGSGYTNGWYLAAKDTGDEIALSSVKWHEFKLVYTKSATGTEADVELYVDGVKANIDTRYIDGNDPVSGIQVHLSKWTGSNVKIYIDNVCVTTDGSNPKVTLPEDLVKDPVIYYTESFDDETVGEDISGLDPAWFTTDYMDQYKVAADPAGKSGNVLQTAKITTGNPRAEARPWKDYTLGKAVLEYKLYYTGSDQGMYPLAFFSSQQNALLAMLVLQPGGALQYQNSSGKNVDLTTLSADTWHDIKLIVDVAASRWYLCVDGEVVANISGFRGTIVNQPYIRGIELNAWGKHTATGIYYDDIVVSEYMPVTGMAVAESELTMRVGGVRQLNVTFEGSNASAPVATYTVDEAGSSVVSVDMFGKVTALANGTATITVSHPDLPDGSKTVKVTVESETITDPKVYFFEDFKDVELTDGVGDLPEGTNANNGGYRVSEFTDSDGKKHQALEVYVNPKTTSNLTAFTNVGTAYNKAVLEYDLYFNENVNTMYAMSIRGKEAYSQAIKFVLQVDGIFRTNSGVQLAKLDRNTWHKIKIVGDAVNHKWYLWINDTFIPVEDNSLPTNITGFNGWSMDTYHASGVFSGIYYDNIKLSQYVPVDSISVEETTLAMSTGETKQLTVSVAPANTSLPIATYTSSDPSVAVVDGYGKITAVREGTTTITVASP